PLGTAGALAAALPKLGERFVLMYGDTMLDVALDKMLAFHETNRAEATLFAHPNDHPYDSDLLVINEDKRVLKVHEYPHSGLLCVRNLVNAALYTFETQAVAAIADDLAGKDVAKHLVPRMITRECRVFAYAS